MDYAAMSDFEINKAAFLLAVKLGFIDFDDIMQNKNPDNDAVMYGDGANWYAWDGCNNPSDSWPIIESFKCAFTSEGAYEPRTGVPYHNHENRLRAAMIVFLMMSEANNATN